MLSCGGYTHTFGRWPHYSHHPQSSMTTSSPNRKGIILAGGAGTRLYPVTRAISKQLLPVYDKPMIYYPLSTLMLAGIREILLDLHARRHRRLSAAAGRRQPAGHFDQLRRAAQPEGLAQAFIIGREFVGRDRVALILGDNIFYGQAFRKMLETCRRTDQRGHRLRLRGQRPRAVRRCRVRRDRQGPLASKRSRSSRSRTTR